MGRGPTYDEQLSIQEESVQNQVGYREKRTSVRAKKGKNTSISSPESTRILRSRTQEKSKPPEPPISSNLVENGDSKKRKKKEQAENVAVDEYSRIRRNISYVVNRIKYEQTLIDAYSGEGWKGQSLEKIRPEGELRRAKSEIFRRKSIIRDLFLRIHMLCNEGKKIPKTLSDSTGEIDSEDLCCAKCGSKEFPANKDIIICDGCCERGFHLSCLEPPILIKDLHLYEDNWLCPACDCKFDCVDLVNDVHGADFSMTDSWEKVFPETAKDQDEDSGLPSDDSDDDDFDLDGPVLNEKLEESNDSDSSEDSSKALPNEDQYLGLPSDDSEDDDFNPVVEEDVKKESSGSDFTSDSEDFSAFNVDKEKSLNEDEQEVSSKSNYNEEDDSGVLSGKRNVERLNYKKLHDEEYGSGSSDSSDEDYTDNNNNDISVKKKRGKKVGLVSSDSEDLTMNPSESQRTPKRRISKKVDVEGTSRSPSSGKSTSKSTNRRLGEAVTQRLYEYFNENQYPDVATKESLAKELGITAHQVNKWFMNTRWSYNHPSAKRSKMQKNNTSNNRT